MTGDIGAGLQYLRYGYANGHCLTHLPGLWSVFCWDDLFLKVRGDKIPGYFEYGVDFIHDGPRLKGVLYGWSEQVCSAPGGRVRDGLDYGRGYKSARGDL